MRTHHIHITGQVQGVGFRPLVYRVAIACGLSGYVTNGTEGVHIICNATKADLTAFCVALKVQYPPNSVVESLSVRATDQQHFDDFRILPSVQSTQRDVLLSPDFALCADCRSDLFDPHNRRHGYAFTTCTQCGPRLSIISDIPYDREYTTMSSYTMCATCANEYDEVQDRRYYSQTNSCPDCGVKMSLVYGGTTFPDKSALQKAVELLASGNIVAAKGIGGYLLLCDAQNAAAVQRLRSRKHRPTKPFAVLYGSLAAAQEDTLISPAAAEVLTGAAAPIVLCPMRASVAIAATDVAPGLDKLGVMLPNSPMLALLAQGLGRPMVATSANAGGSPIWYDAATAEKSGSNIADAFLHNDRDILMPQDDSVVAFSPFHGQKIILRRGRGLAPTFWSFVPPPRLPDLLAMGADLKSAFALTNGSNCYTSQYLGNLSDYQTERAYHHTLTHYLHLTGTTPAYILHDLHPQYVSTRLAQELSPVDAKRIGIPHHQAHLAACLLEHDLLDAQHAILGVVWDGVGWGSDGQIWGGEFFKYTQGDYLRAYYFDYFDYLQGDKMALNPRLAALSLCKRVMGAEPWLRPLFSDTEWLLYQQLLQRDDHLQTSSVGRIFDGVAALLGLSARNSYEGESAMYLERLALGYFQQHGLNLSDSYIQPRASYYRVPTQSIMQYLVMDLAKGRDAAYIAAKFHVTLIRIVENVARNTACKHIAFSGGVFQNGLLVDLAIHHLKPQYSLYFHEQLSPNDECISVGQMGHFIKSDSYVLSNSR